MRAADFWHESGGRVSLIAGAGLLYAASRAAVDALAPGGASAPGRRAVGHWMPIAAAALVATVMGRADVALAVVFSTSVASLSLVTGVVTFVQPEAEAPPRWRRVWPFALPAAMLVLMAGFSGQLKWLHAGALLLEGAVLLGVWLDRAAPEDARRPAASSASPPAQTEPFDAGPPPAIKGLNFLLCIGIAVVGAACAVIGVVRVGRQAPVFQSSLITATSLGPLLVVPMILGGAELARLGRGWAAVTTNVGVVLLNLCLLLPLTIALWYPASTGWFSTLAGALHDSAAAVAPDAAAAATQPATTRAVVTAPPSIADVAPLPFPAVIWRVDVVLLVLLGFLFVPVAAGRWKLGRAEAAVLVCLYAIYILMSAVAGLK